MYFNNYIINLKQTPPVLLRPTIINALNPNIRGCNHRFVRYFYLNRFYLNNESTCRNVIKSLVYGS